MRRTLRTAVAASLGVVVLLSAGCGVLADDRAAVVGNRVVTTGTVDELARDADFTQVVLQGRDPVGEDEATVDGDIARDVLLFEIQRAALLNELERWEVDITDDHRSDARDVLEGQVVGGQGLAEPMKRRLVEFLAAQSALDERFAELDTSSDQDLRALYDGAPGLWDRVCVVVTAVTAEEVDRAGRMVERGRSPEQIARRLEGAAVVADPDEACLPVVRLPAELRRSVLEAASSGNPRKVRGPVVTQNGTAYVYRIESHQRVSFEEARPELEQLASSLAEQGVGPWIGLVVLRGVEINPRYGSEIVIGAQDQLQIAPPQAPPSEPEDLTGLLAP